MNMTRLQWLSQFFRPRVKARVVREKKAPRPLNVYRIAVVVDGHVRSVYKTALTKSEARAQVKRELGLDRLPAGTPCDLAAVAA